ncbi:hypothetical protein JOB18_028586 [Solea senegalensis]|uniref:Uncharacterized protein n=1 Tax=Solea senegalensis TaxID=28829 RepID=A0AAV6QWD0_SOLSE|nr:hypothetical protein JOB18_028586 [Solea senegalensis]
MDAVQTLHQDVTQLSTHFNQITSHPVPSPSPACVDPSTQTPVPSTPPLQHRDPQVPTPERYLGDMGDCGQFLLQFSSVFQTQPFSYTHQPNPQFIVKGCSEMGHCIVEKRLPHL